MQAKTTAQPVNWPVWGATEVVTTFTDLPKVPDVEIAVRVWDEPDGQRAMSGVYRVTLTDSAMTGGVTDEDLRRVAALLPSLAEQATTAAATPDLFPAEAFPWADLTATTVGREVLETARVYVEAVRSRKRPAKAVMEQLHLSRATAARRIREAKDRGLIPERERDV